MENIICVYLTTLVGHQIPYYYLPTVSLLWQKKEEALKLKYDKDAAEDKLTQDEDVLDTWFSSWLWPITVFDGINDPDNEEINYYYPTSDLVTAPEIISSG